MERAFNFLQIPWKSAPEQHCSVFRPAQAPTPQPFLVFPDFLEKVKIFLTPTGLGAMCFQACSPAGFLGRVPDADKSDLLYTPIFPGHTFVEEMKVAVMLPSCAPVWDMFKPWRLAVTMVTRTILIPTALCGNLRHRLQASVAANTQGCQQEWVNTGHVAPAHQRSGKQFPRPQTHPFSQHQLQYWRNCTSDSWVPTTVQTSYTLQFRAGPPFRGITVTSMSDPLQVLALRQEVDTLL
ncbi:UNVERIFIED_CONTAM: hypothetical protein FKN15_040736 [Acipenser sinensis]